MLARVTFSQLLRYVITARLMVVRSTHCEFVQIFKGLVLVAGRLSGNVVVEINRGRLWADRYWGCSSVNTQPKHLLTRLNKQTCTFNKSLGTSKCKVGFRSRSHSLRKCRWKRQGYFTTLYPQYKVPPHVSSNNWGCLLYRTLLG